MIVSQKIEINPTELQKKVFENYFNYSKYIYNKGLAFWKDNYEKWKSNPESNTKPSEWIVKKMIIHSRSDWEEKDLKTKVFTSHQVLETTIKGLAIAFRMFMNSKAKKTKGKIFGYPKFKSKKNFRKSCWFHKTDPLTFGIINNSLKIQGFTGSHGLIKMKEKVRFENFDIKEVCISKKANRFFASLVMEVEKPFEKPKLREDSCVGIDLGIKTFATVADDNLDYMEFPNIVKELEKLYGKTDRLLRFLERKRKFKKENGLEKDSHRYLKMKTKLEKIYAKISRIKINYIHHITSYLCMNYKTICIEDLKIRYLIKNRKLSKAISRSLFYTFRKQLEYKSKWYGNNLVIASKNYPSTQICYNCGHRLKGKDKLTLNKRTFRCPKCGIEVGRDINAAINLMKYGKK